MAKQWTSRLIVGVQAGCWFIVIFLLMYRGIKNVQESVKTVKQQPLPHLLETTTARNISEEDGYGVSNQTLLFVRTKFKRPSGNHQLFMGLILISIASLMVLATCAIVLAGRYERHRYKSVVQLEQLPPRYEDVVGQGEGDNAPAPRYSSLDLVASNPT